jgi:hypothetical protein
MPPAAQRSFGAAKRANGLDRAVRYVRAIGARHVVPSAGPACFLHEDLFALNDLTRDPANTFPDQMAFLDYLRDQGIEGGQLLAQGAVLDVDHDHCEVRWPAGGVDVLAELEAWFEPADGPLPGHGRRHAPPSQPPGRCGGKLGRYLPAPDSCLPAPDSEPLQSRAFAVCSSCRREETS